MGVICFLVGELRRPAKNSKGNELPSLPSQVGQEKNMCVHICVPGSEIALS